MGGLSRAAVFAWPFVAIAGCASIAGLDGVSEQQCAPNCGVDGGGRGPDTGGVDATSDMNAGETGGGDDSSGDTGKMHDSQASDSPSACGALNTPTNCSACGDKCSAKSTSQTTSNCSGPASGAGATCEYTCASGWLDCNATTQPPDLDGCECNAPGATLSMCCSGDCPVSHDNGLGLPSSTFYDCVPAKTIDSQLAEDACKAYLAGADAGGTCTLYNECGDGGIKSESWCSGAVTGDCICWFFDGTEKGMYLDPLAKGIPDPSECYCNASSGPYN